MPKVKFICTNCNKEFWKYKVFRKRKHRFCNNKCMGQWMSQYNFGKNNSQWKGGLPDCKDCGKKLSDYKCQRCIKCFYTINKGKNHCSWKGGLPTCLDCNKILSEYNTKRCRMCQDKFKINDKHHNWRGGLIKKKCIICGNVFQINKAKIKISKFCSRKCYGDSKKGMVGYWKNKKIPKKTRIKISKALAGKTRQPLSLETRIKIGNSQRGEKSSQWKGGITPIRIKLYNSWKWKQWRMDVFKRNNYVCQKCNKRGGRLHSHHCLIPFSQILNAIKEWANEFNLDIYETAMKWQPLWDINNGQTLCLECHRKTESWGGKKWHKI